MPHYPIEGSIIREKLALQPSIIVDYSGNNHAALDYTILVAFSCLINNCLSSPLSVGIVTVSDRMRIDDPNLRFSRGSEEKELQRHINDWISAHRTTASTTLLPDTSTTPVCLYLQAGGQASGGHWQLVGIKDKQFTYYDLNEDNSRDKFYSNTIQLLKAKGINIEGDAKQADIYYRQASDEGCGVAAVLNFLYYSGFLTPDEIKEELSAEEGQLTRQSENTLRLCFLSILKEYEGKLPSLMQEKYGEKGALLATAVTAELDSINIRALEAQASLGDLSKALPQREVLPQVANIEPLSATSAELDNVNIRALEAQVSLGDLSKVLPQREVLPQVPNTKPPKATSSGFQLTVNGSFDTIRKVAQYSLDLYGAFYNDIENFSVTVRSNQELRINCKNQEILDKITEFYKKETFLRAAEKAIERITNTHYGHKKDKDNKIKAWERLKVAVQEKQSIDTPLASIIADHLNKKPQEEDKDILCKHRRPYSGCLARFFEPKKSASQRLVEQYSPYCFNR